MDIAEIKRKHQYGEHPLTTEEIDFVFQELEKLQQKHRGTETSCKMAWDLVEQLQQENERYKEALKRCDKAAQEVLNDKHIPTVMNYRLISAITKDALHEK